MKIEDVEKLNACSECLAWLKTQPNIETAWRTCERGDWMIGLLRKSGKDIDRKVWVRIACKCARLVLHLAKSDEAKRAIETAEAWLDGKATEIECRAAAEAADAAYAYDAADAAYAYAAAADAAEAVYAYDAAVYAADAVYAAAAVYAYAADMADIIREYVEEI